MIDINNKHEANISGLHKFIGRSCLIYLMYDMKSGEHLPTWSEKRWEIIGVTESARFILTDGVTFKYEYITNVKIVKDEEK